MNKKSLRTVQNLFRLWKRFVDDTFIIQCIKHQEVFLKHSNIIDGAIQFTIEDTRPDCSMLFLNTLVTPEYNKTLSPRVYRKPIHTEQYLHWDSHIHIGAKYRVINTFKHNINVISSTTDLLRTEVQPIREVLTKCKYLTWTLNKTNEDKQ